jgi:5-dehydro-2-deoxygluconokinase
VIFDIDYRPYSWPSPEVASEILSRAGEESDMIVGNDEEFGFMAGGINKGLNKARDLASERNRLIIYKMGEEGAITLYKKEEIKTGVFPTQAVKPNGAGDSFMAGLLSSLASGYDLKNSVIRGSACASIVVSLPGCAPAMPNEDQLNNFINNHPIKDF